jgi:hypothetical protein
MAEVDRAAELLGARAALLAGSRAPGRSA